MWLCSWEICTPPPALSPSWCVCHLWKSPSSFPLEDAWHQARANPKFYQLSCMPFKWQRKMFYMLLGQYDGQAEFKTVPCSLSSMSCIHHCTRRELKYKILAAERNSWHGFGLQAFTVLFNSNYRNFKHVKGEPCFSDLPNPPHSL